MAVSLQKRIVLVSILVTFLGSLSGCSGEPPGATLSGGSSTVTYHPDRDPLVNPPEIFEPFPFDDPERADEDRVLVRHLIGEPRNLNPIFAYSWFDFYFGELIFSYIFRRNSDLEYEPSADRIASYELSDDQLVWTVHLTPGMTWHDGTPYTAHDIRFTWEAIRDPQVPASFYKHTSAQLEDVKVIDDLTVQYIHKEVTVTAKVNMAFPIIPKHIYGNPEARAEDPTMSRSDYYNHYNHNELIGAGPYTFTEWKRSDRLTVDRWEDYPFQKPHFKRQILKVQPDRNVALLLFKKGGMSEIWLTPQQFATQTNDEDFAHVAVKGTGLRRMFAYVGWNMDGSNPFFADARVRKAMAHAYDVERIIERAVYNLYSPSNGIFDPQHWCYNPDVKRIEFDLDKAAELLDEAGWLVSDRDGYRYKEINGQQVQFVFELLMAQSFADALKMADIFRDDLKRIGISFDTRVIENASFDSRTNKHEYQAIASVYEVSSDPDQWRNHWYSTEHATGRNFGKYNNPRVDALLDLTRSTLVREERAEYFREIQLLVYEDHPMIFMWNYALLRGFDKNLRGINYSPAGIFLYRPGQAAWWYPKDRS